MKKFIARSLIIITFPLLFLFLFQENKEEKRAGGFRFEAKSSAEMEQKEESNKKEMSMIISDPNGEPLLLNPSGEIISPEEIPDAYALKRSPGLAKMAIGTELEVKVFETYNDFLDFQKGKRTLIESILYGPSDLEGSTHYPFTIFYRNGEKEIVIVKDMSEDKIKDLSKPKVIPDDDPY